MWKRCKGKILYSQAQLGNENVYKLFITLTTFHMNVTSRLRTTIGSYSGLSGIRCTNCSSILIRLTVSSSSTVDADIPAVHFHSGTHDNHISVLNARSHTVPLYFQRKGAGIPYVIDGNMPLGMVGMERLPQRTAGNRRQQRQRCQSQFPVPAHRQRMHYSLYRFRQKHLPLSCQQPVRSDTGRFCNAHQIITVGHLFPFFPTAALSAWQYRFSLQARIDLSALPYALL